MSTADLMLTIFSIQLEIKFPCKMSLHHNGKPLTSELEPKANVFTFNQDINIKTDAEDDLEINAYLTTEKGGSILAGIITSPVSSLISREGQTLTLALNKCIDAGATARIKVNHVWVQQKDRQANITRSSAGGFQFKANNLSPPTKSKLRTEANPFQTKSEYQGNALRRNPTAAIPSNFKNLYESPRNLNTRKDFVGVIPRISVKNQYGNTFEEDLRESRTIGGAMYNRQRKSREKERNAAKKVADETENNLKMDVLKYKMKAEELDKAVTEKTKNIKELKDQILDFERRNIQKAYIQEELTSKESTIQVLQERIGNLNTENIGLRETIADQIKMIGELKENIRFDLMKNKEEFQKRANQLRQELASQQAKNNELEMEVNNRTSGLNKAKKYIEDLEAAAEQKIFEHDRLIQDIKKSHAHALKQMGKVRQENEARIQELVKDLQNKSAMVNKSNEQIMGLQQQQRGNRIQIQNLQIQKAQLLLIKTEHVNLVKKYAVLEESLRQEQRNSRRALDQKNKQIQQNTDTSAKNIKSLEEKLSASYEKSKQFKQRIQELQNQLLLSKNQEEKYKKIIQKHQRLISEQTAKIEVFIRDAKASENRIANLQKQLHNKSSNTTHMQSLYKIELEHSRQSVHNLTRQLEETNHRFSNTKENLELAKNEKTKLENKIQLMEDNQARLNEYIKEKKNQFEQKQNDYKNQLAVNRQESRKIQILLKEKQKQINNWEITDLNYKNKIQKLEKSLEENQAKFQKLEKVTLAKANQQKQKLRIDLEATQERLRDAIQENKYITNQTKKLQSETSKNSKINDVLSGEKIEALNQINKLKNAVARHQKNEEKLNKQLKASQDQTKKLLLKMDGLEKQNSKNRDLLNQTLSTVYQVKKVNTARSVISQIKEVSNGVKKKESLIENLSSSRIGGFGVSQNFDVRKISQIIQSMSKEQQNTIQALQDNIAHYKQNVSHLENQLSTQNFVFKTNEERMQETIDKMNSELEEAHTKILDLTNHYEDRISKLETDGNKKDKDIKLYKSTIGSLKYEIQTLKNKMQILGQEGEIRENRISQKNGQLESQIHYFQMTIKNLQTEKKNLQHKCLELEDQNEILKEDCQNKEKQLTIRNKKFAEVTNENNDNSKHRKEHLEQLLSLREELQALKEDSTKTKQLLRQQEKNNKSKQDFINQLIKQKETIVKAELESSSKVIETESQVLDLKTRNDGLEDIMNQKEILVAQLKGTIKQQTVEMKNLQSQIKDQQNKITQLNTKVEQKDSKIAEKEREYKELTESYNDSISKHKEESKKLKGQIESIQQELSKTTQLKNQKILLLEKDISTLQLQVDKAQKDIMQREQTIFFEKQKSSLNESMINELKKELSQTGLSASKYEAEIRELSSELNSKEQTLFDYSGKIYQLEQRVQMKQIQANKRVEKMDYDWQCRHDEICEQYEQRVETLEKEKKYLRDKLDLMEIQKIRISEEKISSIQQFERDLGNTKARSKDMEEEKLHQINLKNKQIEKYKSELSTMQKQLKNNQIETKKKENEITNKEEAIKKLEVKILEHDKLIIETSKKFEKEIQELKKKETVFKNYREEMKNMQWVVQREAKKVTQLFIQKVINCCPEAKEKLVEPIRSLETSMSAAINFKL